MSKYGSEITPYLDTFHEASESLAGSKWQQQEFCHFSNYNRNDAISTDAISFYANVPIFDALNITEDKVNRDDQFTRETAITQDKFLDLVNL